MLHVPISIGCGYGCRLSCSLSYNPAKEGIRVCRSCALPACEARFAAYAHFLPAASGSLPIFQESTCVLLCQPHYNLAAMCYSPEDFLAPRWLPTFPSPPDIL